MTDDDLLKIHGPDNCYICGKPKALPHDSHSICSYPHGMVPIKAVDPDHPEGFWTWARREEEPGR